MTISLSVPVSVVGERKCATVIAATLLSAGVVLAQPAVADSTADTTTVKDAVTSLRAGTSCTPLHDNATVEQAAEIMNRSTDDYISYTATHVPISDPLPGLKDLGYIGNKALRLQGSHKNATDALKGMLVEGYRAIPDCSYTDLGVSVRRNEANGYTLVMVVLAGP